MNTHKDTIHNKSLYLVIDNRQDSVVYIQSRGGFSSTSSCDITTRYITYIILNTLCQ